MIILHDNCPAHAAKITQRKLEKNRWNLLQHPLYSLDMAPSDYYLFRNMKTELFKSHFVSAEDVEGKLTAYFDSKSEDWFSHGFEM